MSQISLEAACKEPDRCTYIALRARALWVLLHRLEIYVGIDLNVNAKVKKMRGIVNVLIIHVGGFAALNRAHLLPCQHT